MKMSFAKTTCALAFVGVLASSSVVLAQAGGPDVSTDAKAKGTMENGSGSTGMSKGSAMKHMSKKHSMKHSMKKDM